MCFAGHKLHLAMALDVQLQPTSHGATAPAATQSRALWHAHCVKYALSCIMWCSVRPAARSSTWHCARRSRGISHFLRAHRVVHGRRRLAHCIDGVPVALVLLSRRLPCPLQLGRCPKVGGHSALSGRQRCLPCLPVPWAAGGVVCRARRPLPE